MTRLHSPEQHFDGWREANAVQPPRAVDFLPTEPIIISMKTPPATLKIAQYPQLSLIAWSRQPGDEITAEEAFGLYESNWRFIEQDRLDPEERDLIDCLIATYGNGLMNV